MYGCEKTQRMESVRLSRDDAPDTLGTYIITKSLCCSSGQASLGLCERNYLKDKV